METKSVKTGNLIGLSRSLLQQRLTMAGVRAQQLPIRVQQIFHAIYQQGITDANAYKGIGGSLAAELNSQFCIALPKIVSEQISGDGTRKWLMRLQGTDQPLDVETVFIPDRHRGTLCVSSQVGCSLNCSFCLTGTQRMMRNLSPADILGQILVARNRLWEATDTWGTTDDRPITNIVMMGMGEPLLNYENVRDALLIAMDDDAFGFSRRRVTLSTSGIVPEIQRTGNELNVALAISLHAVRDDLRDELVPINRKYPIAQLLDACRSYPGLSRSRRIAFEYVMLDGVNDTVADATELSRLLRDIPSKVNLIPFNPWPGSPYACSTSAAIDRFKSQLHQLGVSATLRHTRGQDIMAACGQLHST